MSGTENIFSFQYNNVLYMQARRLVPRLLVAQDGDVVMQICHGGKMVDHGRFVVDLRSNRVIAYDFKICFQMILHQRVESIDAVHVFDAHDLFMVVDNGIFARGRILRRTREYGPDFLYIRAA